jgi:arylsulfatase A-like enzyme
VTALLLTWLMGCGSAPADVTERVVLVTVDTLRADRLGCYGAERARTPIMDTLAASGVRFETAISPAPLTLPAHASLMTALDPPRHGVRHNSIHRLPEALPTLAESMRAAGFRTAAFVGAVVLDRRFGLARGFDVYDDEGRRGSSPSVGYSERPADAVVDAALAWLASAPPRFFLWVHFYDPHARYAPPPGFAAAFASDRYAGEIAFVDRELGRLLAGIDARFGPSARLVALTSDHGESLGEHGEPTHAYGIYDATQRIPLILSGAGLPAGRVVEAPVRLIDVAPTLLAMVGAPPLAGVAGRDLAPRIAARGDVDEPAYLETLATHLDYGWSPLLGLRTREFKYIRAPRPELYDLAADPDELHDLAAERPELVRRLDAQLQQRLAPPASESVPVELSESERASLRSLGYVVPTGAGAAGRLAEPRGPDPKDEIGLLQRIARAEELAETGRLEQGLALLEELPDPPPHVRILRASLRQNAGRSALAAQDARRALALEPRRVDARLILAAALESLGELAGAREAFEAALALEPRSLQARRGVLRISERLRDDTAAEHARGRVERPARPDSATETGAAPTPLR